jgi:hypothetical protein
MSEKSKCCKASVLINYGEEGTNYYICPTCNNACDLAEWNTRADHIPVAVTLQPIECSHLKAKIRALINVLGSEPGEYTNTDFATLFEQLKALAAE